MTYRVRVLHNVLPPVLDHPFLCPVLHHAFHRVLYRVLHGVLHRELHRVVHLSNQITYLVLHLEIHLALHRSLRCLLLFRCFLHYIVYCTAYSYMVYYILVHTKTCWLRLPLCPLGRTLWFDTSYLRIQKTC